MDSFWDVLSKLFSIVKKILILTYLWRISTFSLLSYIEIYIDYSETALGGVRDPIHKNVCARGEQKVPRGGLVIVTCGCCDSKKIIKKFFPKKFFCPPTPQKKIFFFKS